MALQNLDKNNQANESISKYKLLSAYGGPGSIMHTQYGSIIVSCIEEWGFLKRVLHYHEDGAGMGKTDEEIEIYVNEQANLARNGSIGISNDKRLLESLRDRKELVSLKYLALVPDIALNDFGNRVNEGVELTIPSTFMPKIFADRLNIHKSYGEWFTDWTINNPNDNHGIEFFPPKKTRNEILTQDNIVLICEHGHISDFPWSQFLRWRRDDPTGINRIEPAKLFTSQRCCNSPKIKITSSSANASGFDGKWITCDNCPGRGVSLKGLMGVKIECPGHKTWEVNTEGRTGQFPYSGNRAVRNQDPPREKCEAPMIAALTTANNLYYSRILSSIFMPDDLFKSERELDLIRLEEHLNEAINSRDFIKAQTIQQEIANLESQHVEEEIEISDSEKEIRFRNQEFKAFRFNKAEAISQEEKHLKVRDVTENLTAEDFDLSKYFSRVLRIDNMKITSAQLDFSRVVPADADAENLVPKNIFRENANNVIVYPVVENFGEGIFISLNEEYLEEFENSECGKILISEIKSKLSSLQAESNRFNKGAIDYGNLMSWQLYLVHTLSHLIMRELEFRCGYPTASLSERLYVSNDDKYIMYGFMIYTAEGAEGSMGGLIAQTRPHNLNKLILSALKRATICHSDPLCWESEGQGLFDLNFASCFSCSLVSETSCEHRNLYLDRKILVDEQNGFFRDVIN